MAVKNHQQAGEHVVGHAVEQRDQPFLVHWPDNDDHLLWLILANQHLTKKQNFWIGHVEHETLIDKTKNTQNEMHHGLTQEGSYSA
jgi:hypothetical protein